MRWLQVEIPLGGLDQYTDAAHSIPGAARELENMRFRHPQAIGMRYGHELLPKAIMGGGNVASPVRLISSNTETLLAERDTLYAYGETGQVWSPRGQLPDCLLTRQGIWSDMADQGVQNMSVATNNGITVVAWYSVSRGNGIAVIEEATQTILSLQQPQYNSNSVGLKTPHVLAIGDYIHIVSRIIESGASEPNGLFQSKIDVVSASPTYQFPAFAAITALTGTPTTDYMDACTFGLVTATTYYLVAYVDGSGETPDVYVERINASTAASDAYWTASGNGPVAVEGVSTEKAYTAYLDGATGNYYAQVLTNALVAYAGPATLLATTTPGRCGISRMDATTRMYVWQQPAGTYRTHTKYNTCTSSAALGTAVSVEEVIPVCKPWRHATTGNTYMLCQFISASLAGGTAGQDTLFLFEIAQGGTINSQERWVGTAARGIAGNSGSGAGAAQVASFMGDVCASSTREIVAQPLLKQILFGKDDDDPLQVGRSSVWLLRWEYDPWKLHSVAQWGQGLFIASARPSWYDGKSVTEHGFAWFPEEWTTSTGAGQIDTSTTSRLYTLTYEWEDARGYITRSAPGPVVDLGAGTAYGVTSTQAHSLLSSRDPANIWGGGVGTNRLFHYRTLADQSEPFYRGDLSAYGFGIGQGVLATSGTDSGENDAGISNLDVLYTSGDILDNAGTPPCQFATYHDERLWIGGLEEPNWLWFSQPYVEGEQPRFNEGLRLNIGDVVVGMASLDSALIVFSRSAIYAVHGSGPPATGGLDIGFAVSLVTPDIGLTDWRSVVKTPQGIMFQGQKGLYLLGRDMSVVWQGAMVQTYLDSYPEITGAALARDANEVAFTALNSGRSDGIKLVYNYEQDKWATDNFSSAVIPSSCATIYDGGNSVWVVGWSDYSSGQVARETIDAYSEGVGAASHIPALLTTGWVKLNTIQGWQRIRKLLVLFDQDVSTVGSITVKVGFDYSTTWSETHTFSATEVAALTTAQIEVHLTKQRCEAVRFQISSGPNADVDASAGPTIRSLVLEAGLRPARTMELDASTARK